MSAFNENVQRSHVVDVLVVDDDLDAVVELSEYLTRAKLTCKSASSGWGALELLADGCRPSVVVTDLRMPELDGMELAGRLNGVDDGELPEIIFVSGHAGFDDAIAALRLGARDMLTKPVDGPKLVRAVKSALLVRQARHRTEAPAAAIAGPGKQSPAGDRKRAALSEFKAIRRARSTYFPSELFSDPCWEMLLDLYDAQLSDAEVTVTSLAAASGVPPTTALRRMETLQSHGLIVRIDDPGDRRRTIIRLTEPGFRAVENFFESYLGRQRS